MKNMCLPQVGTIVTSMAITGFALGYALDRFCGTSPVLAASFGGLGYIGGMMKAHQLLAGRRARQGKS
ncbi:MAG: AtpZ/AtpI family protein [Betaproteobacteria bacterium]|nr:AtpZ/AtpI family protein [Betaproteobacteria bacterium]